MNFIFNNLTTILRVVQSTLITFFLFRVLTLSGQFNFIEVMYEISITFATFVFTGRKSELTYNILASCSLFYLCMPSFANKFRLISLFYCFKIFQLRIDLKDIAHTIAGWKWIPNLKYLLFVFNFIRFTTLEYLFLGSSIAAYKIYSAGDQQQLPQDYQLWYQFLVTCSTIGYGDVTPKSKNQMVFFTMIIPIICGSFAIYLSHLSDAYSTALITQEQKAVQKEEASGEQPVAILTRCLEDSKISKIQLDHLTQYAKERAKRIQVHKDLAASLASMKIQNDETIQTAINLKRYDPMIRTMFTSTINDSLRKKIAQNIREIYLPKSTVIISKNQKNPDFMYIHQGTVRAAGEKEQKLKHNTFFNERGFYFRDFSEKAFSTDSFCVIWAIDSRVLRQNFEKCFPQKNQD